MARGRQKTPHEPESAQVSEDPRNLQTEGDQLLNAGVAEQAAIMEAIADEITGRSAEEEAPVSVICEVIICGERQWCVAWRGLVAPVTLGSRDLALAYVLACERHGRLLEDN